MCANWQGFFLYLNVVILQMGRFVIRGFRNYFCSFTKCPRGKANHRRLWLNGNFKSLAILLINSATTMYKALSSGRCCRWIHLGQTLKTLPEENSHWTQVQSEKGRQTLKFSSNKSALIISEWWNDRFCTMKWTHLAVWVFCSYIHFSHPVKWKTDATIKY